MFLEAGKHVLVEYPMALSAKAAHELCEMAEQKGNAFVLKGVKSITCWVAPKASQPNSQGSSLLLVITYKGVCLSQRCVDLGFKLCVMGKQTHRCYCKE